MPENPSNLTSDLRYTNRSLTIDHKQSLSTSANNTQPSELPPLRNPPFGTASIRRYYNGIPPLRYVLPNPLEDCRLGVKIIDRNIEEALDLRGMEVHGDDVVSTSHGEHVGNKFGRNWGSRLHEDKRRARLTPFSSLLIG